MSSNKNQIDSKMNLEEKKSNSNIMLAPVLSKKISECVSFHKNQYMISDPILFTIYPNNVVYPDNSKVCIKSMTYSYDYIGLPSPISFYLCNAENSFKGILSEYFYEKDSTPKWLQEQIAQDINEAYEVKELADSIGKTSDIHDKFKFSIDAANLLGKSILDASNTIKELIQFQYSSPLPGSLEDILINVINSVIYVSRAGYLYSDLLNDFNTTTIENIAYAIYDSSLENDSAVDYILNAASLIETYPDAPAQAVNFANEAKTLAEDLKTIARDILASPDTQNFNSIADFMNAALIAVSKPFNGFFALINNSGNNNMLIYSHSIDNILKALSELFYTGFMINSAESQTEEIQMEILNNISGYINAGADDVISALDYKNVQEKVYLYNNFQFVFSAGKCGKCLSDNITDNYIKSEELFHEKLDSFEITNLLIEINGTIGCYEFTAAANFDISVQMSDLGFKPINLRAILHEDKNSAFSLIQTVNTSLCIDCILPVGDYSTTNPHTINVELNSYLNVESELLVINRRSLAAYIKK